MSSGASSIATSTTTTSTSTSTSIPVITSFPSNPLTTTFVPPDDCTGLYSSTVVVVGDRPSCLPSGFSEEATAYFSPGIVCPSGYWNACHDTTGVASITTVTCCPVFSDLTLSCADANTISDVWSTLFCTWIATLSTNLPLTLSPSGITSTTMSAFTSPQGLNAFGVRMVHEASDLVSSSSSHSTTVSTTSTASAQTPTDPGSTVPNAATTTPMPTSSGGLSTNAVVSIAVVVPVVVVALAAGILITWWCRRRRARYKPEVASSSSPGASYLQGAQMDFTYASTPKDLPIRPGALHELPETTSAVELSAGSLTHVSELRAEER